MKILIRLRKCASRSEFLLSEGSFFDIVAHFVIFSLYSGDHARDNGEVTGTADSTRTTDAMV